MIEASQNLPRAVRIIIVIGAVLIALRVLRLLAAFLADLFHWSNADTRESATDRSEASEQASDPVDDVPGLHVVSELGAEHRFVGDRPTDELIRQTLRELDWVEGFHQVILVTSPGVSLEVGGSLSPEHGLSSVYRDSENVVFRVTKEPPASVGDMEELLVSFRRGDGRWETLYSYE